MTLLIVGLALFVGAHLVPAIPALGERLSAPARKLVVTVFALGGFAAIIAGWGPAGAAGVAWTPPAWTRHITLALMLPALILLFASGPGPSRIKSWAKHPMIAGVKVWAFAHLLSNGEWRSLALFGGFLAYAVFARIALKRRGNVGGGPAPTGWTGDLIAVVGGAGLYVGIAYYLHPILFGVPAIVR